MGCRRHLNEGQIATVLRLAESKPRDHALLSLSAHTALRITEILNLNISSILDADGRIKPRLILRQKATGKRVAIDLPEPLRAALRRYLDARPTCDRAEPLFVNQDRTRKAGSQRLTRAGAHNIFKNYLAQALGATPTELRGLSTHTLRRSVALLVYTRYGLPAAQELLGHLSIGSTSVYLAKLLAPIPNSGSARARDWIPGDKSRGKAVK